MKVFLTVKGLFPQKKKMMLYLFSDRINETCIKVLFCANTCEQKQQTNLVDAIQILIQKRLWIHIAIG